MKHLRLPGAHTEAGGTIAIGRIIPSDGGFRKTSRVTGHRQRREPPGNLVRPGHPDRHIAAGFRQALTDRFRQSHQIGLTIENATNITMHQQQLIQVLDSGNIRLLLLDYRFIFSRLVAHKHPLLFGSL